MTKDSMTEGKVKITEYFNNIEQYEEIQANCMACGTMILLKNNRGVNFFSPCKCKT